MNIHVMRSDLVYQKIMKAPKEQKNDIFRYELMKPIEKKWEYFHIPMKAQKEGGYDIIMASEMLGLLVPQKIGYEIEKEVLLMADEKMWKSCEESVRNSLNKFSDAGIILPVNDYYLSIHLANPESPYISQSDGYCGDGGIPGYINVCLWPNEHTMRILPVATAHETNHNIRFQFIRWHDDITLGEMLVSEGLAENFATYMYGEENVGPWVFKTDMEMLNDYIKPLIHEGLGAQGMAELTGYLYGDEFARLSNYEPVGLPYCAGYACGYYLIKYYLKKTGKSIEEATILPAEEILAAVEDFWNERTEKEV